MRRHDARGLEQLVGDQVDIDLLGRSGHAASSLAKRARELARTEDLFRGANHPYTQKTTKWMAHNVVHMARMLAERPIPAEGNTVPK